MYSKDMLIGIILAKGSYDIRIERNPNYQLGYNTRLQFRISGKKDFLLAIQRSLLQHGIKSRVSNQGLFIGSIYHIYKIRNLIPNLPDSQNKLSEFKDLVKIFENKKHLTLEGLEYIMKIKGVIENGSN